MAIRAALVAPGEAAEPGPPGQRALHDPAVPAQACAALEALAGPAARDSPPPQGDPTTRQGALSSALSACRLSGRWRGRPRGRLSGWRPSLNAVKTLPSGRCAAVRRTVRGRPWRSTPMGRLLPALPRSVGCGPVFAPPLWPGQRRCPRSPGAKRSCLRCLTGPRTLGGGAPPRRPAATRAGAASRARPCHSPSRGAASPKGCHS
jgi:hypothetical protein